jgi:TRAP-type C4-dicarboxylate transport system permease small subunit
VKNPRRILLLCAALALFLLAAYSGLHWVNDSIAISKWFDLPQYADQVAQIKKDTHRWIAATIVPGLLGGAAIALAFRSKPQP